MSQEVIVIGGCHHNILGVIRSLGEKGLRPLVIIETKEHYPYVAKSKYIKQCWIVKNEMEVLDVLHQEAGKHGKKPVVIACADNLSSLLDMHYEELSQHYALPGAKEQGRITRLMDKEVMGELAAEVGLLVPRSVATDTSVDEELEVPLPWIIKPLVSKNGVKADIVRIYAPKEWTEYKSRHQARVQVQQLIEKEFEYQLIGLSLNGGEEVIIPGVSHVIRPQSNTNTGFLRYEPLRSDYVESVDNTKRYLKEAGYSGLFSMEFLRGTDGRDYFMEINFRNDGNAICVTAAGVNLPYNWYLSQTGAELDIENNIRTVYVMPEFDDFRQIFHNQLGVWQWIKDIHRTDRFMEFDGKDQKPFWFYLKTDIWRVTKKFVFRIK